MGVDKALLPFQGGPLVEHMRSVVSGVASSCPLQEIILSGAVTGYPSLPDSIPNRGPLGGIHAAMRGCLEKHIEWMVVVPVDMPLMRSEVLAELPGVVTAESSSEDLTVVHFEEYELPLLVRVSEEVLSVLESSLQSGAGGEKLSIRRFIASVAPRRKRVLPVEAYDCFVNTNTADQWRDMLAVANATEVAQEEL
jgi:molybdopterin-guanine dinucleotide biosynthesis protein A